MHCVSSLLLNQPILNALLNKRIDKNINNKLPTCRSNWQRQKVNFDNSILFVCVCVSRCWLYASAGIKTHQEAAGYWLGRVSLTLMFGRQAIYQPSITERQPKLGTIKQPDFWCQCWGGSISAWHAISSKSKEGFIVGGKHTQGYTYSWMSIYVHTHACAAHTHTHTFHLYILLYLSLLNFIFHWAI